MNKSVAFFFFAVALLPLCRSVKAERVNKSERNAFGCGVRGECRGGRKLKLFGTNKGHLDSCRDLCSETQGCTHFTFYDNNNNNENNIKNKSHNYHDRHHLRTNRKNRKNKNKFHHRKHHQKFEPDSYNKNNLCLLFDGCPEVDESDHCALSGNCLTGDVNCDLNNNSTSPCFFQGFCRGRALMGSQVSTSPQDCLRLCSINPNCHWFSFDTRSKRCNFTKECFVREFGKYISGRKECYKYNDTQID